MTNPDDRPQAPQNPSAQNPSSQAPVEGQRSGDTEQNPAPRVSAQEPAEGSRETVQQDHTPSEV